MKKVFVSYSRNNLEPVTQLIQDMEDMGISAWHDQTLTGGQRWWDNILENIRTCDIFIFALSPESWDSEACNSELHYVSGLGKTVLPVQITDGVNLSLLTPPLSEFQVMDYRKCDKKAAFDLVRAINSTPAAGPLPDPLPAPPPVPVSYLSTLKERIDSAEPLTAQAQITLLFKLEEGIRDGRPPAEVRDLLLRLKKRDELLARVAVQVDAALKNIEGEKQASPRQNPAPEPKAIARIYPTPGEEEYRAAPEPNFCPQCRMSVQAGTKFCANCGTALGVSEGARGPVPFMSAPQKDNGSTQSCRYVCPTKEALGVLKEVKAWLNTQEFDLQQMNAENNSLLLQIKKRGGWRDYLGMSTALNIVFRHSNDTLTVEIGDGKWVDKVAVGAVGFLLPPLIITAGFGAWEQAKMPEKVFDFIGTRLAYA
jgi:hypothetical protein